MSVYVDNIKFITEECCNCGMPFAMTKDFQRRRLNDHQSFYCPAGHSQRYTGKTEEQKLKDKLEAEAGRAMALESQLNQTSRNYQRIRARVKNGVCPCCNRTFQNLLQHMKTEHPDFGEHDQLKTLRNMYGLAQSALASEIGVPASYVSCYERRRPIPVSAANRIERWISQNA